MRLLLHPSGDLLRRPFLRQPPANSLVDRGIIHLSRQWSFPAALRGFPLGLGGVIFAGGAVASQLAADRGRATCHSPGDFLLVSSLIPQLRYAIALLGRKMMCHRWDSVPKGSFVNFSLLEPPSDVFPHASFRGSFFRPRLHLRFETAIHEFKEL